MNKFIHLACFLLFNVVSLYSQTIEYTVIGLSSIFYDEDNPRGFYVDVPLRKASAYFRYDPAVRAHTFELIFTPADVEDDIEFVFYEDEPTMTHIGEVTIFLVDWEDPEGFSMYIYVIARPLQIKWD